MPLFEMTREELVECKPVTFAQLEIREREGLQHILRDHIKVLGDDLLVISEEYGNWEDARRRIDLLALDKKRRLVVIEMADADEAADRIRGFLELAPEDEADISTEVRIVLVSGDFSREITTAVLWLNSFDGMDIRCVQLVAYEINGKNYLDIEQVIPLRQAADYQVQIRKKDQQQEKARLENRD